MLNYSCGVVLLLTASCAPVEPAQSGDKPAVGVWEENSENVSSITLRRSDGTFRTKLIQKYDWSKPPLRFEESGRWSINGSTLTFTIDDISAEQWKSSIGKSHSVTNLEISPSLIRYISTDGAPVKEHRIGAASDAAFEQAELKDLGDYPTGKR